MRLRLRPERGCALTDLTLADLQGLHPLFADDVMGVWDFEAAVERRDATGGTSKRSVLQQAAAQRVALALLGRDYEIRHEGGAVYLRYQSLRLSLPAGPLPVKSLAAAAVAVHRLERRRRRPDCPPNLF